jgi:hypothetical protein
MRPLRRRLSWLLSVWLVCQVVALAAPAALAAAGSMPVEEICTCPGGDHETCPMHHGSSPEQRSSSDSAVTGSCAPADAALLSFAGGVGVLPSAVDIVTPQPVSSIHVPPQTTLDQRVPHDTPPPRS